MIENESVLALIPARGGSKGLPGKNILPLNGKPLVGWPTSVAKQSKYVDRVIVSTDDPKIAEIAIKQGAEVPFLRPDELASDTAMRSSVITHALDFLKRAGDAFSYLVFLEPTSPLTEVEDIDCALEVLHKNKNIADSIVGISKLESAHPVFDVYFQANGLIRPFLGKHFDFSRRQDIPDVFFFEGSLYISSVEAFTREGEFYHDRTMGYIVPKWKSFEIDDLTDFVCIEAIMNNLDMIKETSK
jgi:CMP-N-acetylneuraminic acid synthetase